jgi:hypothetical protein
MPKKRAKVRVFKSKEKKRKYEAYKHIHICGRKGR